MDHDTRERIRILNEKGIIRKSGGGFHSPLPFAVENLYYAAWSSRYECNKLYSVRREFLDFYSIIYVINGQMEVLYEGKRIVVNANEAVLLDFRKPHFYAAASDRLEKWEMVFSGSASEAYYNLITEQYGHLFRVSGKLKGTVEKLMAELEQQFPGDHMVSALIQTMFSYIIRQNSEKVSPPIEEAISYMYNHYGENIQIGDIAEHVSLSRYYFTRLFRKETGRTPNEYLADVRINAAKEMLTERILSVAEIAEQCGFANTSHFTRFFREKTGQTPAAFRKYFKLENG